MVEAREGENKVGWCRLGEGRGWGTAGMLERLLD